VRRLARWAYARTRQSSRAPAINEAWRRECIVSTANRRAPGAQQRPALDRAPTAITEVRALPYRVVSAACCAGGRRA
jgi:hypothetical protein